MLARIPREVWLAFTIGIVIFAIHAIDTRGEIQFESRFLRPANTTALAREISLLGMFALGAGIIIIAGGIDLSSGSVICFTGVMCAKLPEWLGNPPGDPLSPGMVSAVLLMAASCGIAVGLMHGVLITNLGLPPFVATLGTMAGLRSLASIITTGSIAFSDPTIRSLAREWYVPVIIFLVEAALLGVLMQFTRIGRYLQAMGGNEEAARLSGLSLWNLKVFAYCLGSMTSALAGLVYLAHLGSANSKVGVGYELSAIAAAVIGGCNLKGGAGSILGIVLGAVLLRVVINGTLFVIEKGATEWEGLIVGGVVILAVMLGKLGKRS